MILISFNSIPINFKKKYLMNGNERNNANDKNKLKKMFRLKKLK